MKNTARNLLLLALMMASSGLAVALRPTERIASLGPAVDLETLVPRQFGEWQVDDKVVYQQVSPDVGAALAKIYTQVLTRTYVNKSGYRIMLSVPYGANQSDGLAAHDPEGCYPAQGFQIMSKSKDVVSTAQGALPIRRMEALSGARHEMVSYWFTVGEHAVNSDWERKKQQMRYAVRRQIPDGLLVRVSSIDGDSAGAYKVQQEFIQSMLQVLPPDALARVAGLGPNAD
ncbi:exosortase-associated protein EpsI, B-type [Duganella sp. BuS-21]|uniref:exosortase-associated protein EpsI, B-type n=1 Tax=Duganella sp. BuS-21 TaxID=2943848 RepID=UPI0035A7241E